MIEREVIDRHEFVGRCEALSGSLAERAVEAEALRRLPEATLADARAADLMRVVVPRSLGGHGLGLEVHERPTIGPRGDREGPVVPGMVFTVEPGVYLAGRGGVRIEDDFVVTYSGVERLTGAPSGFEDHEL